MLRTAVCMVAVILGCSLACADEPAADDGATEDNTNPPDPDPTNPCAPGPNPSLEIGEGEYSYVPYADGEMIELIHGPQGGVHTLTGLLARDIDGSEELEGVLRGYVGGVGGEQLGGSFPYLDFRCAADDGLQVWNVYLFWDAPAESLHMQPVHIEVEFTDAAGMVVTATKDAVIFDPTL